MIASLEMHLHGANSVGTAESPFLLVKRTIKGQGEKTGQKNNCTFSVLSTGTRTRKRRVPPRVF
jgi:hypothetical protein